MNIVGKTELLQRAKELQLTDERELLCKVVISYSNLRKTVNAVFGRNQNAGTDGFLGIFKNQLVCFASNMFGTKPDKERFRISFELILSHEIKKGFLGLNNQYLVANATDRFKLYFRKKRLEMIEAIDQAIK